MSKKPFLVGDFKSNTGPAIANAALKNALGKRAFYSKTNTRVGRMIELILKVPFCSTVCFCSFSMLDVYGMKIARFFRKKTAYLMHGYIEIEAEMNCATPDPKRILAERYLHENVDIIICVSKLLADKIKEKFPERKNVYVVYNIVEPISDVGDVKKDPRLIFSTGGGVLQKNNLIVCEAIKNINITLPKNKQLKYVIGGKSRDDKKEFKGYDFVDFKGNIARADCLTLMKKSALYLQNSLFETFGLAAIEAIGCGCDVLLSNNMGALEVIDGYTDADIIKNPKNVNELKEKILAKINGKTRFSGEVDWQEISTEAVSKNFLKILEAGDEK